MSIPVPRAPKTRFTAPARAVPAPEEVSAGGLIIDFDRPEQLPVAIIARINRNGQREWCLPKGHIDAKFEIGLLVPICHVRSHSLEREEFRQAPLNVDALVGIGVVRAPKFGEIA